MFKLKTVVVTALLCCLTIPAAAQISKMQASGIAKAGGINYNIPFYESGNETVDKNAREAAEKTCSKFYFLADTVGSTNVDYRIIGETCDYVSFLFEGITGYYEMPKPMHTYHGLTISKRTGKAMELKDFIIVPDKDFFKEHLQMQLNRGNLPAVRATLQGELNERLPIQTINIVPMDFVVDSSMCVYLLDNEYYHNAYGLPLFKLEIDKFQHLYHAKG